MNKNMLVLAYLGDSVYELYIRKYLVDKGIAKVKELQSESIKYVSAKSQSNYLKNLMDDSFLTENEISKVLQDKADVFKNIDMNDKSKRLKAFLNALEDYENYEK